MAAFAIEVSKRWFEEVWNQRRFETINELLDDESVCYGEGEPIRGKDAFIARLYTPMVTAFPDLRVTLEDTIDDTERTVIRWSGTATHTGPGLGIEPTGCTIEVHGMTWLRINDGKLSEGWQYSNIEEVLQRLVQSSQRKV